MIRVCKRLLGVRKPITLAHCNCTNQCHCHIINMYALFYIFLSRQINQPFHFSFFIQEQPFPRLKRGSFFFFWIKSGEFLYFHSASQPFFFCMTDTSHFSFRILLLSVSNLFIYIYISWKRKILLSFRFFIITEC